MNQSVPLLHYRPSNGWFGDPMPLWYDGVWHLYYTKLNDNGEISWGHISTKDFVTCIEHPDPLRPGSKEDMDYLNIVTGSVIVVDGVFHMFYGGEDKHGKKRMLHAVSNDGITFMKEYKELFPMNDIWYRPDGTWRDPCVVWDQNDNVYRMYFCARSPLNKDDPFPGRLGMAHSTDLVNWTLDPPENQLENLTGAPECPDVFYLDNQWAMIYYWHNSRIRFSDSLTGMWKRRKVLSPNHFDFMAAKRASDGNRHVMIGWIPRKHHDSSERIWGGCMAWPRELYLDETGNPACRFIPELENVMFQIVSEGRFDQANCLRGKWSPKEGRLSDGCLIWQNIPDAYRLRFSITPDAENTVASIILRLDSDENNTFAGASSRGYQLIFNFPYRLLHVREHYVWDQRPDLACIVIPDAPTCQVDILLNGDILEVVLNEKESVIYRLMKYPSGKLALNIADGGVQLKNWRMDTLPNAT